MRGRGRLFGLTAAVAVALMGIAGVAPVGAGDAGRAAATHLQPEGVPSCLSISSPWYQQCAEFGGAVATDGSLVVIGAPAHPLTVGYTHYFGVGAAYVYVKGTAGWVAQEIRASDADTWDRFGSAAAADAGRFLVGAPSAGASWEGRAYLYEPDHAGGWDETMLDPNDHGNYGGLGRSVAIDGNRLVVAASGANVADGAVYVFGKGGDGWVRSHKLTSGESTGEGFGYSVAVDGNRIVVGAPYYGEYTSDPHDTPENSGRVFVYTWNGAGWAREVFWPPTEEEWQLYGYSVAVDGDRVFVGARNRSKVPGADDQSGAVFAYSWSGISWVEEEISPAVHQNGSSFGASVAAADGTLLVGAVGDQTGNAQGAAYLFRRAGSTWVEEQLPEPATAGGVGDKFGYAVAVTSDLAVAGAPETKSVGPYLTVLYGHGSAYLYGTTPETVEGSFQSLGPADGWVRERNETSGKGGTVRSGLTTGRLGDDSSDRQYRSILDFDTSPLPDDAVITSAIIRIRRSGVTGTNPLLTHGLLTVDLQAGFYHDDPLLERFDFHAVGTRGNVGRFIKTAVNRWYRAPLRARAWPLINRTGHTQFRLRFNLDDNDDMAADILKFYTGEGAFPPELTITYYVP